MTQENDPIGDANRLDEIGQIIKEDRWNPKYVGWVYQAIKTLRDSHTLLSRLREENEGLRAALNELLYHVGSDEHDPENTSCAGLAKARKALGTKGGGGEVTLPLVLDLFSGTGSATQPFVECGRHRVVRIDIAGKPDVRADVRRIPLKPGIRPQFVWASPPCTEFSSLTNLRRRWPGKTGPRPEIGMELVRVAFSACRLADRFVLENVAGSVPHISREFGTPKFAWAGRYCWSNVELGLLNPPTRAWRKFGRRPSLREPEKRAEFLRMLKVRGGHPDTFKGHSAARSMIPRPLAEAVHRAVCDEPLPSELAVGGR